MSVEDVFERWLAETPFWQTDWPMEQFHNFVFRYDEQIQGGHHVVTLVDSGIPNLVAQPLRPPSLGPQTFMTCQPKDMWEKGAYYSTRGALFQDALRLLGQSNSHATIQLVPRPSKCNSYWELYAGIGSWSLASKACGKSMRKAVENDYRAAQAFRANHETPLAEMDVGDCAWLDRLSVDVVCASPPCPAFSALKGTPGFSDKAALPWRDLLATLRHTQPPFVLLENPSAIAKKQHHVRLFMKLAGYRLVTATDVALSNFSPFQRDRWISVWTRCADPPVPFPPGPHPWLPKGFFHTLQSFTCVADPDILVADLQLSREQIQTLQDVRFSRQATPHATWQARLITPGSQCSTIQRLYGQNFDLPTHLLSQFGLHCPLFFDGNVARLFSPWEIARGLLLPPSTRLPSSTSEAWALLGNSVSQLQCAVGILLLDQVHGGRSRVECNEILCRMVEQAVQIQDVICTHVDGWLELHPKVHLTPEALAEDPSPPPAEGEDTDSSTSVRSDDTSRCCCLDPWDNASLGRCEPIPTLLDNPDTQEVSDTDRYALGPDTNGCNHHVQTSDSPMPVHEITQLFTKLEEHEQHAIQRLSSWQPSRSQGADSLHASFDTSQTPFWYPIVEEDVHAHTTCPRHLEQSPSQVEPWPIATTRRSPPPIKRILRHRPRTRKRKTKPTPQQRRWQRRMPRTKRSTRRRRARRCLLRVLVPMARLQRQQSDQLL